MRVRSLWTNRPKFYKATRHRLPWELYYCIAHHNKTNTWSTLLRQQSRSYFWSNVQEGRSFRPWKFYFSSFFFVVRFEKDGWPTPLRPTRVADRKFGNRKRIATSFRASKANMLGPAKRSRARGHSKENTRLGSKLKPRGGALMDATFDIQNSPRQRKKSQDEIPTSQAMCQNIVDVHQYFGEGRILASK